MELETERLRLTPIGPADEEPVVRMFHDPAVIAWLGGKPRTLEEDRKALADAAAHWQERGYGIWAMRERSSGEFVGRVGLRFLPAVGETEALWTVPSAAWGKGYATEGARAAVRVGFERAGLERLIAITLPDNRASRRVMEKLGMAYEKTAEFHGFECVWYGLSRRDYPTD